MSDVTLKYGSTGFEKVAKELAQLEKQAGGSASWFAPMQKTLREASQEGEQFCSTLSKTLSSTTSLVGNLVTGLAKVTVGIGVVAAIAAGAATAAFVSWSSSVLKTTESFRMLEISLYGATKSWESVNKVSEFAKKYAAEFPAMYKDVMQAMQSFAYIPALKPMIMKGDVEEMHKMMTIVQGMMTMRPDQGVPGAIYALREAMAGNWRSLQFRFDIPIASIAKSAGMSMEEMRRSPADAVKALKSFIDEFVGVETMEMMAKNLSIQLGNLKDKYEMWIDKLGKTGVYQKVVDYLLKLNDAQERFMSSDRFKNWTEQINKFLEDVVDRIAGVFTKGIDWQSIATMGELGEAMKQVGRNAIEELKKVWEVAKEPLANVLKGVFKFAGNAAVGAFKEAVIPAMKEIRDQIPGLTKGAMREAPFATMGTAFATGFMMTPGTPLHKLIGGAVTAEAVALPTQIETIKDLWASYLGAGYKIEKSLKETVGIVEKVEAQSAGSSELTEGSKWGLQKAWKILGKINELLDMPDIKGITMRKALGLGVPPEETREQNKRVEDAKKWMASPPRGWKGPWGEAQPERPLSEDEIERIIWGDYWKKRKAAQPPTVEEKGEWGKKAKQEMEYYSSWTRMAKAMAERDETERLSFSEQEDLRRKEYATVREKWDYGQISGEDWGRYVKKFDAETTKRMRLEDFGKEREQKLETVLGKAKEEGDLGLQRMAYGEMFNIAYQKGDFGAAQEYMNKSLDVMVEEMKKEDARGQENNQNLKEINANTLSAAQNILSLEKALINLPKVDGKTVALDEVASKVRSRSLE